MRLTTLIACLLPFVIACSGDKSEDTGDTADVEDVDTGDDTGE